MPQKNPQINEIRSLLEYLDRFPPFIVLALARERNFKGISYESIIQQSGISRRTLTRLASAVSWKGQKIETASALMKICGLDIRSPHKQRAYVRQTLSGSIPFGHLRKRFFSRRRNLIRVMEQWIQEQSKARSVS